MNSKLPVAEMESVAKELVAYLNKELGKEVTWEWVGYDILTKVDGKTNLGDDIQIRAEYQRGPFVSTANGRFYIKYGNKEEGKRWLYRNADADFSKRMEDIKTSCLKWMRAKRNMRFEYEKELLDLGFEGWQGWDGDVKWTVRDDGILVTRAIGAIVQPSELAETLKKMKEVKL